MRGGVGGDGRDLGERLAGSADEKDRTNFAFGGDGAAGDDEQARGGGERCDWDEADVGCVRMVDRESQALGAGGGHHPVEGVALLQFGLVRLVLEVPHEGSWIQESYCRNAQAPGHWSAFMTEGFHSFRLPS